MEDKTTKEVYVAIVTIPAMDQIEIGDETFER